ncbi:unnamed protein product [Dracunculus medinensis]|uniref:Uncharacterized protein n=1 Tax=Dracunculus medinensis TaxID=318479 RepID=A0A0N4U0M9_DRAME|nr:unnamed protein product [Dracunculus medinensis]
MENSTTIIYLVFFLLVVTFAAQAKADGSDKTALKKIFVAAKNGANKAQIIANINKILKQKMKNLVNSKRKDGVKTHTRHPLQSRKNISYPHSCPPPFLGERKNGKIVKQAPVPRISQKVTSLRNDLRKRIDEIIGGSKTIEKMAIKKIKMPIKIIYKRRGAVGASKVL